MAPAPLTPPAGAWLKGTVFSVDSGDTLTLVGPPRAGGPPLKKTVTLANLSAPRLVRAGRLGGRATVLGGARSRDPIPPRPPPLTSSSPP